jgi:hypothetical protein
MTLPFTKRDDNLMSLRIEKPEKGEGLFLGSKPNEVKKVINFNLTRTKERLGQKKPESEV